ncbi:MAG: SUMF1/EgtB/PvdO family nonheme iron enzyme [Candidatus Brocadiae bacterium]|nr:SUMF1/EgtB/PvdO family nonheme iron enzyme [Candidatus Brocadiia bacterium]
MEVQEKLWRWYEKHKAPLNVVLDIASDMIPGTKAFLGILRLAHGWAINKDKEMDTSKVKEMENFLTEIRPLVLDVVEEIEEMQEFHNAKDDREKREVVEKNNVAKEVEKILPRLGQSIVCSLSLMETKKIFNNRYERKKLLGKGGQGEVYLAWDSTARLDVALKLLPLEISNDTSALDSIISEYQRLVKLLTHDSIVQYRQIEKEEKTEQYFLVMDYIEGTSLRKVILEKRRQGMPIEKAAEMLLPIACALDFAHDRRVVHCDLKPENILVRKDGKMFLSDFGLSTEIRSSLSMRGKNPGMISGTLPYMSPEQYQGKPAMPYTDMWALGVILYEMTAGYHPFNATSFEHFYKIICENSIETIENLPQNKWAVLSSMLDKTGKNRPLSAKETLERLQHESIEIKPATYETPLQDAYEKQESRKQKEQEDIQRLEAEFQKRQEKKPVQETQSKILKSQAIEERKIMAKKAVEEIRLKEERKILERKEEKAKSILVKIPGFQYLRKASYSCADQSYKIEEYCHEKTGIVFLLLLGGTFDMGSMEYDSEKPVHKVTLSPFLMAKYPVTQSIWKKILPKNPSVIQGETLPVENVSWQLCQEFCQKAGLNLPTEAQWEYSVRAGSKTKYYWGNEIDPEYCWYSENSQGAVHPVGEKKPNAFGLYDMSGNVWEFCEDSYAPYLVNPSKNPICNSSGFTRVCRGGSFKSSAGSCSSSCREGYGPVWRDSSLGFRCVKILPE